MKELTDAANTGRRLTEDVSFERLQNFVADLVEDYQSEITFLFFADSDKHDEKELVIKGVTKFPPNRRVRWFDSRSGVAWDTSFLVFPKYCHRDS